MAAVANLVTHLADDSASSFEIRDRSTRETSKRAQSLHKKGHWDSSIEITVDRSSQEKLRPLLENISVLLSPHSSGVTNPTN